MNAALVDKIVQAVLYEGYVLYPYRPSVKNHHRWTFGGISPQGYSEATGGTEPCLMQAQCLLRGRDAAARIRVRFLHLMDRRIQAVDPNPDAAAGPANAAPEPAGPIPIPEFSEPTRILEGVAPATPGGTRRFKSVESLRVGEQSYQSWQEAVERDVSLPPIAIAELAAGASREEGFSFAGGLQQEPIAGADGRDAGRIVREQQAVAGRVEVTAQRRGDDVFVLTVRVLNRTPSDAATGAGRDAALMRSLVSTHIILQADRGEFLSLTDPPEPLKDAAAACQNIGCWPVLVGEAGETDALLASPIILPDYPQIAPESPGDLFDGTEIDEILTLRIMTLTDDERRQAAAVDGRVRALLARTDGLGAREMAGLHGSLRGHGLSNAVPNAENVIAMQHWDPLEERKSLEKVLSAGIELKPGDRVRLRPRGRADIFDLALAGKAATVAAIEQDYENRVHVAVTVDDDPGRDFGRDGKPGHRFFFGLEEVEVLSREEIEALSANDSGDHVDRDDGRPRGDGRAT